MSVSSTERLHGTSVIRSKFSEVNSYRVGATLKYRCERGFILKSTEDKQNLRVMTRRCTTSGGWTGDTPFCTFVDCGSPEIVQNSEYQLQTNNATYFGSVVTYHCNPHFKLEGKPKISYYISMYCTGFFCGISHFIHIITDFLCVCVVFFMQKFKNLKSFSLGG